MAKRKEHKRQGVIREITASEHLGKIREARKKVIDLEAEVDERKESLKEAKDELAVARGDLMKVIGGEGEMPLFDFQVVDARTGKPLEQSAAALLKDREFLETMEKLDAMFDSVSFAGRAYVVDDALRAKAAENLAAMRRDDPPEEPEEKA